MTETTIPPHPDDKNAPPGEGLSQATILESAAQAIAINREALRLELVHMRQNLCTMPFTATQLALLVLAAQEAWIQDPERHWFPLGFETEFMGTLRMINVLTRSTFGPLVQAQIREGWERMGQ